ncbi:hypothetical protein OFY17_08585 [Marinomonas sp. C2222]|uniref:Uncharacterized protein n=1 Tax=Marinomonas sargassi TaxID=2984494 RepID=A0ABT2YT43_9GAMM|nr:hypothetical protein [Marinomonas sargassi]MCV2402935.1 hypothetical protein [Marinomonas sargassi]
MLLSIKRLLGLFDLSLGYLLSWIMRACLYVFTLLFFILCAFFIFYTPFEDSLNISELDNLELLVVVIFIGVSIRFFIRSKMEGLSVWQRIRHYVLVSIVANAVSSLIYMSYLITLLYQRGEFGISDAEAYDDFTFFASSIFYILALYAFTPLPKLSWLSKKKVSNDESEAPLQADFFTDSTGNTHADSINKESK